MPTDLNDPNPPAAIAGNDPALAPAAPVIEVNDSSKVHLPADDDAAARAAGPDLAAEKIQGAAAELAAPAPQEPEQDSETNGQGGAGQQLGTGGNGNSGDGGAGGASGWMGAAEADAILRGEAPVEGAPILAPIDRMLVHRLGFPMIYRPAEGRQQAISAEPYHAAFVTKAHPDDTVNLRVIVDGNGSFDVERVKVAQVDVDELQPGECCPNGDAT